jgi:hypothetical protein
LRRNDSAACGSDAGWQVGGVAAGDIDLPAAGEQPAGGGAPDHAGAAEDQGAACTHGPAIASRTIVMPTCSQPRSGTLLQ